MWRPPALTRKRERVPAALHCRFHPENLPGGLSADPVGGQLGDLHEEGLFLRAPLAARFGQGTRVCVHILLESARELCVEGEVVHLRAEGCGLRLRPLPRESLQLLEQVVSGLRRRRYAEQLHETQDDISRRLRVAR
jgi:hypothetical protein